MYTVQYIVYSKHQHHNFGVSSWAAGISWQRGGMELLGSGEAWRPWAIPRQRRAPGLLDAPADVPLGGRRCIFWQADGVASACVLAGVLG
jgi:hypothetical protein